MSWAFVDLRSLIGQLSVMKINDLLEELVLANQVTFSLLRVPVCIRIICGKCGMRNLTVYSNYIQGKEDLNEEKCTFCNY